MKKTVFLLVLFILCAVTVNARELNLKLSPGWGYLGALDYNSYNLRKFPDLMMNVEFAVEGTRHIYPMIELMYGHDSKKSSWFSSGLDVYGIGIGIKALVKPADYDPETGDIIDRSRYWFSVAPGPYINSIGSGSGGRNAGQTKVSFGIDIGAGIEYYFTSHFGIGGQAKFIYVAYSDNYFLLNFGPSLCGRF
jgi:hypothetical protein